MFCSILLQHLLYCSCAIIDNKMKTCSINCADSCKATAARSYYILLHMKPHLHFIYFYQYNDSEADVDVDVGMRYFPTHGHNYWRVGRRGSGPPQNLVGPPNFFT